MKFKFPKGIHAFAIFFILGISIFYGGIEYNKEWLELIGIGLAVVAVLTFINSFVRNE